MKTVNRGKLFRLAKAGKLEMVGSYRFDDMMGQSIGDKVLPVRVMESNGDFKEGFCNVGEYHFTGKCGRAWENDNGSITLIVHSNLNFDFRIKQ